MGEMIESDHNENYIESVDVMNVISTYRSCENTHFNSVAYVTN